MTRWNPKPVEYQGKQWREADLARHLGLPSSTLAQRIAKGLPLDQRQRPKRKETMRGAGRGRATKHPLYRIWKTMRRRCQDPKFAAYKWYGARGVTVCQAWADDFWTFVEDVGARPGPGYMLEREDNSKGYEPGNVTWATRIKQMRNKSNNHPVSWNGETLTPAEWAERFGVTYHQFWGRLRHYKYDMAKTVASVEKLKRGAHAA